LSARISLREFNWVNGPFLVGYHLALLIGLPLYFAHNTPRTGTIVAALVLLFLTEIGIGGAYHRFYAHRCYKLSKPAEAVLLFLANLAMQGSALQWSNDHRKHHSHVDTDEDPYSIKKGFWYAHCLWLFEKSKPIDERRVADLLKNPLVVFQHRFAGMLSILGNVLVCGLIGWWLDDLLGALVLVWGTRLLVSHHLTWFVNSLAHTWGERTFSKEHSAVDNYILAFLTVGEGYHNYHHTFASDYRNGVRWYHFDPTKWTIWLLSKVGLASELRRFNKYRIERRLLSEDRKLLLATLKRRAHDTKVELEQRIDQLATAMHEKLSRISALVERIKRLERGDALAAARRELRSLKRSMRRDRSAWSDLCGLVLQPA
jgi:stearoyl-CoA desaturase (delta-9 desaturase)